jgi:hypothetical protein
MHYRSSYNHREHKILTLYVRLVSFEGQMDQTVLFKVFKSFMDEAKQIKDMSCILLTKGKKKIYRYIDEHFTARIGKRCGKKLKS